MAVFDIVRDIERVMRFLYWDRNDPNTEIVRTTLHQIESKYAHRVEITLGHLDSLDTLYAQWQEAEANTSYALTSAGQVGYETSANKETGLKTKGFLKQIVVHTYNLSDILCLEPEWRALDNLLEMERDTPPRTRYGSIDGSKRTYTKQKPSKRGQVGDDWIVPGNSVVGQLSKAKIDWGQVSGLQQAVMNWILAVVRGIEPPAIASDTKLFAGEEPRFYLDRRRHYGELEIEEVDGLPAALNDLQNRIKKLEEEVRAEY